MKEERNPEYFVACGCISCIQNGTAKVFAFTKRDIEGRTVGKALVGGYEGSWHSVLCKFISEEEALRCAFLNNGIYKGESSD